VACCLENARYGQASLRMTSSFTLRRTLDAFSRDQPNLRQWLASEGLAQLHLPSLHNLSMLWEQALRRVRRPRSSSLYKQLAKSVSLEGCCDEAFLKLRRTLSSWFSMRISPHSRDPTLPIFAKVSGRLGRDHDRGDELNRGVNCGCSVSTTVREQAPSRPKPTTFTSRRGRWPAARGKRPAQCGSLPF
jgi:hypothetical protein